MTGFLVISAKQKKFAKQNFHKTALQNWAQEQELDIAEYMLSKFTAIFKGHTYFFHHIHL